jgi:hypothetical protein
MILQEYVSGPEYGVFWLRRPGAARGEIFSITEKRLPFVTGDGRSPFEDLVLADDRAVCLADVYLAGSGSRASQVPAAGERVPLTELGTHCRGAVFLDGGWLRTPALEQAFDRIGTAYEGFHFGRFDVRAPDEDAFRAGRFTILELNGLTSEAAHVYDPRHSVFHAWRVLGRQWRLAFEIAADNRAAGARPASWRSVVARLLEHGRDVSR